jgi:hypothetical protein
MITIEDIDNEAGRANTSPTEKQREAGNYMKGHISVKGMKIAIENPKGSKRYYDGGKKYNVMNNHYGYFNITKGKDGDAVDVFLGPDIEDFDKVYCVDQNNSDGEFDETKVMLGFSSKEEAKDAYMSNYSPDWKGFRDITAVSIKDFKKWLYRGRKQRQPFADYVYIQKKKIDEMKKVIKLKESDIMSIIANSVKKMLKESYEDGPTNDPEGFDEIVYYKAVEIMRKYGYDSTDGFVRDKKVDALEYVMDTYMDYYANDEKLREMDADEVAKLMAAEAMKIIDNDYYEEEVKPLMEAKKVVKMNESQVKDVIRNCVKRALKESYEPTREDWDDFGEWASSDEPDLWQDEMGAAHDMEHPEDSFLIDADDEGEGFSKDYMEGQKYARNLIAKSKVPDGMVEELNQKEKDGTISAFELGILDTLDEG